MNTKEEGTAEVAKMVQALCKKVDGLECRWREGWEFITIQMRLHDDVVTLHLPERRFGGEQIVMSQINWSAMGSQPLEITEMFIKALDVARMAAEFADVNVDWFTTRKGA